MHTARIAPGPKGLPLVGNVVDFGKDTLGFLMRLNREYGGVARFHLGKKVAHLVSDPEGMKRILQDNYKNYVKGRPYTRARVAFGQGLITSDGDYWRRHRKLMQPTFNKEHYVDFAKIMAQSVSALAERWDADARAERSINVANDLRNLALQIAARSLFTTDIERDAEWLQQAFNQINLWFSSGSKSGYLIPPTAPTPRNLRVRKVIAEIDALVRRIIAARRRAKEKSGDLLAMLMEARDEEDGSTMTDAELRDESMTLLFAAHESTGTTIAWALSLISKSPEVEKRVREEITRVLDGKTPTFADVGRLPYTRQVMEETMRLYPAGPIIPREVVADDVVAGYAIPAGSIVFLSPYVAQRDPRYWENPEAFDPDRFLPENVAKRPKFSYLPFILGPRQCIGNHFAMTEMLVAVPMLFQRFKLELVPGMQVGTVHLRFDEGMWMTAKRVPTIETREAKGKNVDDRQPAAESN